MTTETPFDLAAFRAELAALASTGAVDGQEAANFVKPLLAEVARLQARYDAAESLTRDTDGNQLGPDENIPVGELQRALFDVAW